jgi:hypothetical protein
MSPHLNQEQADEFSIGAMDESAAEAVAAHIAVCAPCARIVADSDRVAAALLLGIPRTPPPPRLRRRVFRSAGILKPGPLLWGARLATAGAGIAAILVAVASFTGMVSVRGQIRDLQADNVRLDSELQEALSQRVEIAALTLKLDDQARESAELQSAARLDRDLLIALLSPDSEVAEVFPVDSDLFAIGRLIWDPEQRRVWFVASRLPRLVDGETYQLWVQSEGTYVSLGTFNSDATGLARFQALVPQGVDGYDFALVTLETGASSELSGKTLFVADLSKFRR